MADSKGKQIICSSCGAEFEDMLPKCPYCGTMNYKGAEMEYLDRLEDVRSDMEQLGSVPETETRGSKRELSSRRFSFLLLSFFITIHTLFHHPSLIFGLLPTFSALVPLSFFPRQRKIPTQLGMKYPLGREIFSTNLEMTLHYLYPSYDYMAKIMTIRRKEEYAEIKKYILFILYFCTKIYLI